MVTEYIQTACKYTYNKLKDVVYLFDEEHTKLIEDGAQCMISELSQTPLQLKVRNVELNEQSSLDERYKFDKTLTFTFDGYYDQTVFFQRYYAIIEDMDGTRWVVNVDFPSFVTYEFNLSSQQFQTNYTFRSQSNFPTMRLVSDFNYIEPDCNGYTTLGIESLQMIERPYTDLDIANKTVRTYGREFETVVPLRDSISLQETWDGRRVNDTIEFTIPFDAFKYGWHYNLQHFIYNKYSVILHPKGTMNVFYVGFNHGMEATYTVGNESEAQTITVNLRESSEIGLTASDDFNSEYADTTYWVFTDKLEGEPAYECVANGTAMYIIKQEQYKNGMPTGRYAIKTGYDDWFPDFEFAAHFDDDVEFYEPDCAGFVCTFDSNIPNNITFRVTTSYTFSITGSCSWQITELPASDIEVTPSSGTGDGNVVFNCMNIPPDGATYNLTMNVGNIYVRPITVRLIGENEGRIKPASRSVSCVRQDVEYIIPDGYQFSVIATSNGSMFRIEGNKLIVNVPANTSTTESTEYNVYLSDDKGTYTLLIHQLRTFTDYRDEGETMCEYGNLYHAEELYTGTTPYDLVATGTFRRGTIIEINSSRCDNCVERWQDLGEEQCIDGNLWEMESQQMSCDDGSTWTSTGQARPISFIGASQSCEGVVVSWVLTDEWICDEDINE